MTAFAAGLTGLLLGGAVVWLVCRRYYTRRYDLSDYHLLELDVTNVRAAVEIAEERVTEVTDQYKQWAGDLLDTVADRDRVIDGLTRQSPVPTYGAARHLQRSTT